MCSKMFSFATLMILAQLKLIDSVRDSSQIYSFGGRDANDIFLSSVSRLNSSTGEWQIVANMSTPRSQFCGAAIGTKFYLFGGLKGDKTKTIGLKTAEVYDSSTYTFTRLRSMPQRREGCGAAAFNGSIYIAGGFDGSKILNSVIRYNVQTDQWSEMDSMNLNRKGTHLVQLGGHLFAIGGENLIFNEKYDPDTDRWSFVANSKFKHEYSGVTVHRGKIYVSSQYGFETYYPEVDKWWSFSPPNDHAYEGRSLVSMNGQLWAIGGSYKIKDRLKVSKSVFSYDPMTGQWTKQSNMNVARKFHVSLSLEGSNHVMNQSSQVTQLISQASKTSLKLTTDESTLSRNVSKDISMPKNHKSAQIYSFGGSIGVKQYLSSASHYNSSIDRWEGTTDMNIAKGYACGAVVDTKIYLFGGEATNGTLSMSEVFDSETQKYSPFTPTPYPISACAAAAFDGFIYVSGGWSHERSYFNVFRYNIHSSRRDSVEPVSPMNGVRSSHQLVELRGLLYAIGGWDKRVEAYDPTTNKWRTKANTHFYHRFFGAAAHEGKIYVCGDQGFEVYSPGANSWEKLPFLDRDSGRTLVSINGRLWAMGGGLPTRKSVWEYDPLTRKWSRHGNMDTPRRWHTTFVVYQ